MPSLRTTVGTWVAVTDAGTAIRLRFPAGSTRTKKEEWVVAGWLCCRQQAVWSFEASLEKEEKKPIPLHDTDAVENDVQFCLSDSARMNWAKPGPPILYTRTNIGRIAANTYWVD